MSDALYTDDIVCPYCGHEERDSWEWQPELHGPEGDGDTECGECGREFGVSRHVSVSYSTRKKDDAPKAAPAPTQIIDLFEALKKALDGR